MNKSVPLPGNSQSRANISNSDKKTISGAIIKPIPSASVVNGGNGSAVVNVSDPSNGENRKKGLITASHHTTVKKKKSVVGKNSNPDGTATSASAGVDGYDSAHDEEARYVHQ